MGEHFDNQLSDSFIPSPRISLFLNDVQRQRLELYEIKKMIGQLFDCKS
jgi:hypothetical protein